MANKFPINVRALVRLTPTELATLRTAWVNCLTSIATVGAEYEMSGRRFKKADTPEVTQMIDAITYAQGLQNGTTVRRTLFRFQSPTGNSLPPFPQ